MIRPTAPPLTIWTVFFVGLTVGLPSIAHAQYADFKSGTNLEHWRTGQIEKASTAVVADGSVVVFARVKAPFSDRHLILWKLDPDGFESWSRMWDLNESSPLSFSPRLNIAEAPDGSLIITGAFRDAFSFGGAPLVSAGYGDIFLVKLDAMGNHVWSRSFGAPGTDAGYQVRVSENGNIMLAGVHSGVDFGGGVHSVSDNGAALFRATFGPDGTYQSSVSFGSSTGFLNINDITINDAGDLYAIGGSYLTTKFGDITLENNGSADIILVGFDINGRILTARSFGGEHFDTGHGIVQTADGDLLTAGLIAEKVSLGGPVLETSWIGGAFIARYSASGEHRWSRANESLEYGTSLCTSIALHPSGGIIVAGSFTGGVQFDETALLVSEQSMLTMRFDGDGNFLWMGKGAGEATVLSLAAKPNGNTVVVGSNTANVGFCTGDIVKTASARGFLAEFTDTPHLDSEAPPVPAHPTYDGTTVTWDASVDPEGAAVIYHVDEKNSPPWIEKRTIVSGTSMPLTAEETRNRFLYITAIDCYGHASELTHRVEIHPALTAPLAPGDVHFEGESLVWSNPTDADVVGVAVSGVNSLVPLDTVRLAITMTPNLNVLNLSYRAYYLAALDASGNWGDRAIIGDAVLPHAPTGLTYTIPILTWNASQDKGFGYFEVYSSKSSDFSKEKHLLLMTRENTFDVPIDLRDSFYHVVEVDAAGNTSLPTTVAGLGGARPGRPRSLSYRDGRLTWQATDDDDIDRYEIFASSSLSSQGLPRFPVGTTTALEFAVTDPDHRWYFVQAIDEVGQVSSEAVVSALTGRAPSFTLSLGVLSNPFRVTTTLAYSLPKEGDVKLALYDVRGAHVATLVNGRRPGGSHYVDWSGESDDRGSVPSGVYFARLQFERQERTTKLIRLR